MFSGDGLGRSHCVMSGRIALWTIVCLCFSAMLLVEEVSLISNLCMTVLSANSESLEHGGLRITWRGACSGRAPLSKSCRTRTGLYGGQFSAIDSRFSAIDPYRPWSLKELL